MNLKWNISTSSRIFSVQISKKKKSAVRSSFFQVIYLFFFFLFVCFHSLWYPQNIPLAPLRSALRPPARLLRGCGRMLSCHLSAFKALRVGGHRGAQTLLLCANHVAFFHHSASALLRHSSPHFRGDLCASEAPTLQPMMLFWQIKCIFFLR